MLYIVCYIEIETNMYKQNKYSTKKFIGENGLLKCNGGKTKLNKIKLCCLTMATVLVGTISINLCPNEFYTNPGVDSQTNYVVAHAGGALEVDGKEKKYLNSLEGFYHHYSNGTKMFEFDLVFSSDDKLVGIHKYEYHKDYNFRNPISYSEYVNTKIAGQFTGVTEENLFTLIDQYPECKFIIDTKENDELSVYKRIIDIAKNKNIDISNCVVPFVSSKEMLLNLEKIYNFNEIMFTNYKKYYSTKQLLNIIDDCKKIKYLHIFPIDFFSVDIEKINQKGVRVFAHMDKENKLRTPLKYGCTGVFSDNITENDFKKEHYEFLMNKLTKIQNQVIYNRNKQRYYKEASFEF